VKSEESPSRAGIKEIAKSLGISIGTVDRALHNRPGISPTTRAQVLKMAERLNYRPNVVARSLKLNRNLRIGVRLPREIAAFFDPLRDGIRSAAERLVGVNIDLDFRAYPHIGKGDVELLDADVSRHYDGMILTPGDPGKFDPVIRNLVARGTPVVCVASDAPRSGRIAAITVDAAISGAIAAELFARTLLKPGGVAIITGDLSTRDHADKLKGFAGTLATLAPHLSLLPAIETHDIPQDARRKTLALLERKPRPAAIYISTANSLPVLRALDDQGTLGQVLVVATDLFPELVPFLESGRILAALYQRPAAQGKAAVEALVHYVLEGKAPTSVTRFAPHIVLRSNLPLFLDQVPGAEEFDRG
jgi:LacI family transcriptional regulator